MSYKYSEIKSKLKRFFKQLFCRHDFKYTGKKNGYFTHTCKKCNTVQLEKEFD